MTGDDALVVNRRLRIPRAELTWRATRSGGPGGQHVNTSATRVELLWDVSASPSLSEGQRALLLERLSGRMDSAGVLRVVASSHRSQHRNRAEAEERLARVVADALHVAKKRKPTRPTRASKERRLKAKKRRSETKRMRGPVRRDD